MRPVVLVIRDGWGINPDARFNAVANARTPNMDRLVKSYATQCSDLPDCRLVFPMDIKALPKWAT